MRVNDKNYALFDYEDGPSDQTKRNPFQRGDVVIKLTEYDDTPCNEIGVVLQVHDAYEVRTDNFGNEGISRLRLATVEEINTYSTYDRLKREVETIISNNKSYYVQHNVGRTRYCLSYHNGYDTHKDGSPFYGIYSISNKKALNRKIKELKAKGYVEI
ncbi:hypothetical protein E6Q11_05100 [Candidatus Dojkabacteria bacterium]|uniref:Uncharacterized protein n=1 Tax=Candidatus Dojkabacteria bacterium TaxID=2099670 RepID=A0A5C7J452_9BACT|nr:MAG: hypothetical protein E6Q11_05100 [Candidatus Dojkabacteria bacterium]